MPQFSCHFRTICQKTAVRTADSAVHSLPQWRTSGYFYGPQDIPYPDSKGDNSMLKFVILGIASLAFVGTAVAADLPRPQPVAPAPVGKYPVGKYPLGKSPVGKYPVAAPVVTKG